MDLLAHGMSNSFEMLNLSVIEVILLSVSVMQAGVTCRSFSNYTA